MTETEFLALEPRERDAVVAEARGVTCVHEFQRIPLEVLLDDYKAKWKDEYGTDCPDEHARGQVEFFDMGDYPEKWCARCHMRYTHEALKSDTGIWTLPPFTTDIATAWELVEEMRDDLHFELKTDPLLGYGFNAARFDVGDFSKADTMPLVISIAYMKAKGAIGNA